MDPLSIASGAVGLIGAISNIGANRKNRQFQEEQNRQDREFQREMYWNQRQDAVRDTAAANAYNHPLEQMNRLRQAGLNPNLVYGKGAETTSVMTRGSTPSGGSMPAPKLDYSGVTNSLQNALSQFQNIKLQQAQTDNVHQQTAVARQEELLKSVNVAKTLQETAKSKWDLEMAQELKDATISKAQLENKSIEAQTQYTLDKNQREALINTKNIEMTVQNIIKSQVETYRTQIEITKIPLEKEKLQKEIDNLEVAKKVAETEGKIKEIDLQLKKKGVDSHNPSWYNMLLKSLIDMGFDRDMNMGKK